MSSGATRVCEWRKRFHCSTVPSTDTVKMPTLMRSTSSASRLAGSSGAGAPEAASTSESIEEPLDRVVDAHEGRLGQKDEDAAAEAPLLELEVDVDDEGLLPAAHILEDEGAGLRPPAEPRGRGEAHDLLQGV